MEENTVWITNFHPLLLQWKRAAFWTKRIRINRRVNNFPSYPANRQQGWNGLEGSICSTHTAKTTPDTNCYLRNVKPISRIEFIHIYSLFFTQHEKANSIIYALNYDISIRKKHIIIWLQQWLLHLDSKTSITMFYKNRWLDELR